MSPYDARWPELYGAERARLKALMGPAVLAIHHVGSTSVPGLCAKPVLDILCEAVGVPVIDGLTPKLEQGGLEARGEYGIPGRRYFVGYAASGHRLHVHVFARGHGAIRRHLVFRDYLRGHPVAAGRYGRVKQAIAARYPHDPRAYQSGKAEEVEDILAKAEQWAANV